MNHDDFGSYWAGLMDSDSYAHISGLYEQQELSLSAYGGQKAVVMLVDMKQDV
jgi:hypothetical protein